MKLTRFADSLAQANSLPCGTIARYLRDENIPVTDVDERPSIAHDRAGIDYIAYREGRRPLNIDLKEIYYAPDFGEAPDVLLEIARVGRNRTPGWATDSSKKTDLFLFVWGDGSALVLPAFPLRAALAKHGERWACQYRRGRSATQGYHEVFYTEYIVVPQSVLLAACEKLSQRKLYGPTEEDFHTLRHRIECLRRELNHSGPWPYGDLKYNELISLAERLDDEVVNSGW